MTGSALILGASGGIGGAISTHLGQGGWHVTGLSRSADGFDYADPARVDALLSGLDGPFDLVFIATGALEIDGHGPEKALRHLAADALAAQFRTNTIGPALVMRHAARLLPRDRPATIAALSARVGSIGDNHLGGWYGYRAAKAALNQIMHGAAIELGRTHKQSVCVALHPGTVSTDLTATHGAGHDKVTPAQAAANLLNVLADLTAEDSGLFFDWQGKRVEW
ncbi:SDR family NAD(P)-dependent oxidoreductase [Maritimibacter sp. UBA3975]|uniref:SDR family NAD(P)-dependent oxidoreductase n=1 Tax=Maritimibacter sp. UBA3975 TaxID=1946833 RepID=UPI000C0A4C9E|nr:SDR family NAD(P)-dependent oxidoreductase [Maritimibacter sp. UBA3975]MAM60397.1 C factor, cell signaling protein [Maritimibacter sp.]|tara:strand:+ start:713 stop:1381 length:669 start_codon:yes stop_codon:yes gene_type:complete